VHRTRPNCRGKSWEIWSALQAAATGEKSSEFNNKQKITKCAHRASDSAGAAEANKAAWQHNHAYRLPPQRGSLTHQLGVQSGLRLFVFQAPPLEDPLHVTWVEVVQRGVQRPADHPRNARSEH